MTRPSSPRASDFLTVDDDTRLVTRAAAGEVGAFEELYRRHSQAAWRVAQSVVHNSDDAADAVAEAFTRVLASLPSGRLAVGAPFRPYLLAATRNAAIDILRRSGRVRPTDDSELDGPALRPTPLERAELTADSDVVVQAFRELPERWRSVLWLTEVEGMPARDVAPMLGLTPNGTAQLAVRARAGLRERYLQAHVRNHARPECLFTVDRLGAYAGGALSARDTAKVDQHLAGCEDCRERLTELEDLAPRLRHAILPIPIGLAGLAVGKWQLANASSAAVAGSLTRGGRSVMHAQRALAVASASLLALGVCSTFVVSRDLDRAHQRALERRGATAPKAPESLVLSADSQRPGPDTGTADADGITGADVARALADGSVIDTGASDTVGQANGVADPPAPAQPSTPPAAPAPTAAAPVVQVSAAVSLAAPVTAVVSAGAGDGSCTGVSVDGQGGGCTAPAPTSSPTLTVDAGGESLPPVHVGLP